MPTASAIEKARADAQTPPTLSPQQVIKQQIDHYRPVIVKLLTGTGITEDQFSAQIANALRAVPDLWKCDTATVLGAALRCAQLGLAPNDPRNLAWILPYAGKAQFQLGYGGVLELARRAVPGLRFDGRPVFPNDEFDLDYGKAEPLKHRPSFVRGMDRGGDAYAWYVRATFPDGSLQIHALDREGVEYHRGFSKQKTGKMWTESYDAAALKSTVLDMRRWLPQSTQLLAAIASDNATIDVRHMAADLAELPTNVDGETGEIIDAESTETVPAMDGTLRGTAS